MPRKSAASLAVVVGTIDGRPQPPEDLTDFQKAVWKRTVASEASAFFKMAATQQLLQEYCRHVEAAHILEQAIAKFDPEWLMSVEFADEKYDRLLRMRARETGAILQMSTRMRLTNQARYTPQAAAAAGRRVLASKPWYGA